MAPEIARRVVLISLRPVYADLIRANRKIHEYRRVRVSIRSGDLVLVYETAPVGRVTLKFSVGRVYHGAPNELAQLEADGEVRRLVAQYLQGARTASALEVIAPVEINPPVTLGLLAVLRAPQSYIYLNSAIIWDSSGCST